MSDRSGLIRAAVLLLWAGLFSACAPPERLPAGLTPIPTLIPISGQGEQTEIAEQPFTLQSYPAQLPSASKGLEIYQEFCSECHGPDGTGLVPGARNFRDLDYTRGETPQNFYAAVTEGRNEMPSYSETLSSDERWDVVFYIWRLSTSPETIDLGSQIYAANCSSCHGADGAGEQLGSADFTELREMDNLAPRDLYLTITQGRGSMPAWQSLLSQDERWAVIDFVRTFTYNPSLPADSEPIETADVETPGAASCSPETNPFDFDNAQAIQAGGAIFDSKCAACHGADGSGALPGTPDFTSAEIGSELRSDADEAYCILANGQESMPAFGNSLSVDEMWQAIVFLASLAP